MTEKQSPLHKQIMGVGHDLVKAAKTNSAAIRQRHIDSKYIDVPITIGFAWDSPAIGHMRVTKEAASMLKAGMVLSPAYTEEPEQKLIGMGLTPAARVIPPEGDVIKAPDITQVKEQHYTGFGWYLFIIAIIAGILAIIALLIRVFYIRFS